MDEIKKSLIHELVCCTKLQSMLSEVQLSLANKINTLEEKMIVRYFWQVNVLLAKLAKKISLLLLEDKDALQLTSKDVLALGAIRRKIEEAIKHLNKIVQYDTAFLEQYFEHDYYARLVQEHCFVEQLEELESVFSSCLSGGAP